MSDLIHFHANKYVSLKCNLFSCNGQPIYFCREVTKFPPKKSTMTVVVRVDHSGRSISHQKCDSQALRRAMRTDGSLLVGLGLRGRPCRSETVVARACLGGAFRLFDVSRVSSVCFIRSSRCRYFCVHICVGPTDHRLWGRLRIFADVSSCRWLLSIMLFFRCCLLMLPVDVITVLTGHLSGGCLLCSCGLKIAARSRGEDGPRGRRWEGRAVATSPE